MVIARLILQELAKLFARVFAILHSQQQDTHDPFRHNFNKLIVSSEQWN